MFNINHYLKRPVEVAAQWAAEEYCKCVWTRYLDFKIGGFENLVERSAIVVPNHVTGIDGVILTTILPRHTHFLIQNEGLYNSNLKMNFFCWLTGEIPINVESNIDPKSINRARDYLRLYNDFVGVFSEGPAKKLLDATGKVIEVKDRKHSPTAAIIAVKEGVPLIPIGLRTSDEIKKNLWEIPDVKEKQDYLRRLVKTSGKIPYSVNIGLPIYPRAVGSDSEIRREVVRLTKEVRAEVIRLYEGAK